MMKLARILLYLYDIVFIGFTFNIILAIVRGTLLKQKQHLNVDFSIYISMNDALDHSRLYIIALRP